MKDLAEQTTIGLDPDERSPHPPAIGPYRIIRLLGEGGMGRVYLAEQSRPRREVALKIVHGLSTHAIERMRRESEVLAQLEHPGIARLYAAGESRSDIGSMPWLAMEYIDGVDLATWAANRQLDVRARLRLLIEICRAVQYAHLRGVIHRDLKPGNIMVDTEGCSRILDFGIARMRDAENSTLTQAGQVLGTLSYMSPEQLSGNSEGVDARSDVYSLGVVAYELIGGRLPHPRLATSTLFEALEVLRHDSPPALASVSAQARGDLDTVVMKALSPDVDRRYLSAAALADDLQRFLDHRPVLARPPTRAYRAARFVRRHRTLTAALAGLFAILSVASVVSLRFGLAEQHARSDAEQRERESTAVSAFLQSMLSSADPEYTHGNSLTVSEVVDQAERDLAQLDDQPGVQRAVAFTLAATRATLGDYEAALNLNTRVLALDARSDVVPANQHANALRQRATTLIQFRRFDEARAASDQAIAAWPDADPSSRLANDLTRAWIEDDAGNRDQAVPAYRAILTSLERLGPGAIAANGDLRDTLQTTRSNLSAVLREQGQLNEAEALTRQVLTARRSERGERAPATLASRHKLAMILEARGEYAQAETEMREVLVLQREVLGDTHARTLTTMQGLANILAAQHKLDEAEVLARESQLGFENQFGESHVQSLTALNTLAYVLEERLQIAEAETLYRRIVTLEERGEGDHPSALPPRNNLAMLLMNAGRGSDALAEFDILLDHARRTVGEDHAMTAIFMSNRGLCLATMGRLAEARVELEAAHQRLTTLFGAGHARTHAAAERLADVYARLGMSQQAAALRMSIAT